ncbi:MAG: hypothetical protein AB2L20_05995 [Mangrovibacterium sp.]
MKFISGIILMLLVETHLIGWSQPSATNQHDATTLMQKNGSGKYWNSNLPVLPFRLAPPPIGYQPEYLDFDQDGDPDAICSVTKGDTPVLWIDDDDDMKKGDLEGDTDNDCLLIDRNKDGRYGNLGDLIIDWGDQDRDQTADMQVIVEYPETEKEKAWPYGHYMWVIDTDHDQVFNYIDWNAFQLKAWEFSGTSDFIEDYSGQSLFLKVHAATNRMEDLRFNWENPFLFYDEDGDHLSEMAIRLVDSPRTFQDSMKSVNPETIRFAGKMDWISIAVDLDNDNGTGHEFDFDFTLGFRGEGFDYTDQKHDISNIRGLAAADSFFLDPRWRHLDELIYPGHDQAVDLIFRKGNWDKVYFVYDEDDDCHRWERVEFLDPLDPFKIGYNKGGIDNHPQSDASGDRGEWDLDNSGKGKLYISKFDGRLHLYGAEWGCWRIDQQARYYQGYNRTWKPGEPGIFPTVKYSDTDHNGFIDQLEYDLDGDHQFEEIIRLKELGVDDRCELYDPGKFTYTDYTGLKEKMAGSIWNNACKAVTVAKKYGLNTNWYAKLKQAGSTRDKYHNGYWLQYSVFKDLQDHFIRIGDQKMLRSIAVAYFSSNWDSVL